MSEEHKQSLEYLEKPRHILPNLAKLPFRQAIRPRGPLPAAGAGLQVLNT